MTQIKSIDQLNEFNEEKTASHEKQKTAIEEAFKASAPALLACPGDGIVAVLDYGAKKLLEM